MLDIKVRLATAQDRASLDEFYKREGLDFHDFSSRLAVPSSGTARETMYIIAVTIDMVVAALKLDVVKDPELGDIGHILHFEIEDELEGTELGIRMIEKAVEIADKKGLRALDAIIHDDRADVISLFTESNFTELRKEVYLRRNFRQRIF
jgi:ribosomal protein S18 acetylase RimI-like enzyme